MDRKKDDLAVGDRVAVHGVILRATFTSDRMVDLTVALTGAKAPISLRVSLDGGMAIGGPVRLKGRLIRITTSKVRSYSSGTIALDGLTSTVTLMLSYIEQAG